MKYWIYNSVRVRFGPFASYEEAMKFREEYELSGFPVLEK